MKCSALITAAQAALFIGGNVLIEDYRSEQCETRENGIVKETGWQERTADTKVARKMLCTGWCGTRCAARDAVRLYLKGSPTGITELHSLYPETEHRVRGLPCRPDRTETDMPCEFKRMHPSVLALCSYCSLSQASVCRRLRLIPALRSDGAVGSKTQHLLSIKRSCKTFTTITSLPHRGESFLSLIVNLYYAARLDAFI